MPKQCEGFSAPLQGGLLEQCPYDAEPDETLCYFHAKVIAGQITTIDGKRDLSWLPFGSKKKSALDRILEKHDSRRQLQEEWA